MPSFSKDHSAPLALFAELNDTALYGSQRQVLGHAVKSSSQNPKTMDCQVYNKTWEFLRITLIGFIGF
ncbi:hypothetical protein QMM61_00855 [Leptospira santarosai]|uniref:hypothetical protein n=1 Tax=Leptospira santarosai TaxID=28183 RepID=UPI0024AF494D|nr:hypothetical protein [Leptospira santarosai]MDI7195266.1 hypothetical protein [Leptospira santarosai]